MIDLYLLIGVVKFLNASLSAMSVCYLLAVLEALVVHNEIEFEV